MKDSHKYLLAAGVLFLAGCASETTPTSAQTKPSPEPSVTTIPTESAPTKTATKTQLPIHETNTPSPKRTLEPVQSKTESTTGAATDLPNTDIPDTEPNNTSGVLYSKQTDGQYDLYILEENQDTGETQEVRLTDTKYDEMNAQFSPDGEIAYVSNPNGDYDAVKRTIKRTSDGWKLGDIVNLTVNLDSQPTSDWDIDYSPDGNQLILKSNSGKRGDGVGDIYSMDLDGTNVQNLTEEMNGTEEWAPRFVYTKDGKKILFTSGVRENSDIFIKDLETGEITNLTDDETDSWYADPNKNGTQVVYICKDPAGKTSWDQICVMGLDGQEQHLIPNQPKDGENGDPAYDINDLKGVSIYFIHYDEDGAYNLYRINTDGSKLTKLTEGSANILSPDAVPASVFSVN